MAAELWTSAYLQLIRSGQAARRSGLDMLDRILVSSQARWSKAHGGAHPGSRPPYELLVALMIVVLPLAALFVFDGVIPFPRDGSQILIRGVRADVRTDLVRGLTYAPLLLGCLWLSRFPVMRRKRPALLLVVIGLLSATHVVEALLISALAPGTLTGSATAFRWATIDAYSAARLSNWATVVTLVLAYFAWRASRPGRLTKDSRPAEVR
jgi:hypothetical protein